MIKSIIYIILVASMIFPFKILAQELPDYVLPSPQAYEITRYGETPIDESSGRISPSVSLYNYNSGAINLPISISYSGGGVKVSDKPTWTGNNWTLNAGGVITRIVKDLPDETSMPRLFYDEEDLENHVFYQNVYMGCYDPGWLDFGLNDFDCENDDGTPYLIPSLSGYYLNENIRELITRPDNYDTEADIFSFSFGNYSGSFVLDENFNAMVVKNEHDLQIEIIGNFDESSNYEFIITTTEGVKYFFGGYTGLNGNVNPELNAIAVEETQFVRRNGGEHFYGKRAKTSFYLTKIENHVGDWIQFEYYTNPEYEVLSFSNQSLSTGVVLPPLMGMSCSDPNAGGGSGGIYPLKKVKNMVYNGKFLRRIWSNRNNHEIIFNSAEVSTTNQYYRILQNIDFDIKTVNFQYWPPENNILASQDKERFFLEKIKFEDETFSSQLNEYRFEYDELESVPSLNSYAQDYLGYYNGKLNNPNLLPREHMQFVRTHMPLLNPIIKQQIRFDNYYDNLADRDPYFEFATKGILKKMHYPTGGFTEIEYEPVDKKIISEDKNTQIYSNMGQANPAWFPNSVFSNFFGIGDPLYSGSTPETVFQTQDVNFKIVINTLDDNGLDYHDYVYLIVRDINTNEILNQVSAPHNGPFISQLFPFPNSVMNIPVNSQGQTVFSFLSNDYRLLQGHQYEFKIGFGSENGFINESNTSYFSSTPMFVNCSLNFIKGYDENDGLGIRVKRVVDYDKENSIAKYKRFYYKKAKDIHLSFQDDSKVNVYAPFFLSFSKSQFTCSEGGGIANVTSAYTATLNSNSGRLRASQLGTNAFYRNVTISYGGENFENGGIEKQFNLSLDQGSRNFKPDNTESTNLEYMLEQSFKVNSENRSNYGVNNGVLEKETVFKMKSGNLFKVKDTYYEYNLFTKDSIKNMGGLKLFNLAPPIYDPAHQLYDLYFGLYYTFISTPILRITTEIDFIDPVPLSAYIDTSLEDYEIEAPHRKVKKRKLINYNLEESILPLEMITTKSDNSKIITKYKYPLESHILEMDNLTGTETANYQVLRDDYRISEPIQVDQYLERDNNSTKLSTQRTIYSMVEGVMQPSLIQASKGEDALETRVEFLNYDVRGNPTKVRLIDGSTTKYVYNSFNQVIKKIENYTTEDWSVDMSGSDCEDNNLIYDGAFVTQYYYDVFNHKIVKITDAGCNSIQYEYDEFHRLEHVKDKDDYILSKNQYNYQTQN